MDRYDWDKPSFEFYEEYITLLQLTKLRITSSMYVEGKRKRRMSKQRWFEVIEGEYDRIQSNLNQVTYSK